MSNSKLPRKPFKRRIKIPKSVRQRLDRNRKNREVGNPCSSQDRRWISPDAQFCNTIYAAEYIGRSVSRMQSMRCEGVGPRFIKRGRRVIYRVADLKAYFEEGLSLNGPILK